MLSHTPHTKPYPNFQLRNNSLHQSVWKKQNLKHSGKNSWKKYESECTLDKSVVTDLQTTPTDSESEGMFYKSVGWIYTSHTSSFKHGTPGWQRVDTNWTKTNCHYVVREWIHIFSIDLEWWLFASNHCEPPKWHQTVSIVGLASHSPVVNIFPFV